MKDSIGAAALLAMALGACSQGGETSNTKAKEEKAASLEPGEYELVSKVESIRTTDNTTPASQMKEGETATSRTCVGSDHVLQSAAFLEANESCNAGETYMSRGRMSLQFQCNRPGHGSLSHLVDGKFKADSFSGTIITATLFSGSGDYELRRSVEAKRVGDCAKK